MDIFTIYPTLAPTELNKDNWMEVVPISSSSLCKQTQT